jgi:hypothetical protein
VLTDHTPPREEGRYIRRDHVVRPHIECLLQLREHFRLGVYSSATIRTVNRALGLIRSELNAIKRRGVDGAGGGRYGSAQPLPSFAMGQGWEDKPRWQHAARGSEWWGAAMVATRLASPPAGSLRPRRREEVRLQQPSCLAPL